jgi:hypothetical protein
MSGGSDSEKNPYRRKIERWACVSITLNGRMSGKMAASPIEQIVGVMRASTLMRKAKIKHRDDDNRSQ